MAFEIFKQLFCWDSLEEQEAETTCEPDAGIETYSQEIWQELRGMPHIVKLIEEDVLVDLLHHTYLYWNFDEKAGMRFISLRCGDMNVSLVTLGAVTKLRDAHKLLGSN